jgi:iron complex outermembrane recepter protein
MSLLHRLLCLVLLAALPATVPAQSVPPPPADPAAAPVTLSVFEVRTDRDQGYQAANTLSGSRLNSSLRDTAASVQVFTPEYISDFAALGLADITAYSPNVSVDMLETSSDANPTFIGGSDLVDTRLVVRGLQASVSMDFFEAGYAVDSYNTERAELASGPNSILFGFGAPGGLVNVMTKRAQVDRNRSAARVQAGQWGLRRFELDHNQVIFPGRLALRLNGLDHRADGWRRWDFSVNSRFAASLRYVPLAGTRVTANYENGQLRGHVLIPATAFDANALWLASGRRTMNDAAWTTADRAAGVNRNTATRNLLVTDGAGAAPFFLTTRNVTNFRVLESSSENLNLPVAQRAGLTMTPFSAIPYENSVFGPGAKRDAEFDRLTLSVEQRLPRGLTLELSALHERTRQWVISPVNNQVVYAADPNLTIPAPDGGGTVLPNPNAGRLLIDAQWKNDDGRTGNDVARASLAWQSSRGRFGTHNVALMAEHGRQIAWRYPGREILVDEQGVPIANALLPEDSANFITRRHYVVPGDFSTYIAGNADVAATVVRNGRAYHRAWIYQSVAGGSIRRTTDSLMAVTQSAFLDQRLVITAGARIDRLTFDEMGSGRLGADHPLVRTGRRIANTLTFTPEVMDSQRFKPLNRTLGAVWHATPWLSLFGNVSDNNAQPKLNVAVLPDEKLPPPATGETRDFGFAVSLPEGRVHARVTAFATAQRDAAGGNFNINLRSGTYDITAPTTRILQALLDARRITSAEQLAHTIGDESNLAALSDIATRGVEASVWFNPSRNLTGLLNFSRTTTDRSNVFPEFEGWFEREKRFWLATPGAAGLVNATAGSTVAQEVALIELQARRIRDFYNFGFGERPYKANASGRYAFTGGTLKGAFIGGGVRWQARSKLGRVILGQGPDGKDLYGRALFGPEDFKVDAFAGYRRRVALRGRSAELTLQLNVTNLTDEEPMMPMRYNATQTGYLRILLQDPRRMRLTAGLSF